MEINGYFTRRGLELSAKLASGAKLEITKVLAGSGSTADTFAAIAMAQPRQTLAVNTPTRSGNTAAIPATLTAAQAEAPYTLTELGVYAADPDQGEILYKLYRLDTPVDITAGSRLVLRFYLEETVSQDVDVTVACSPAGLLTEADLAPVREAVLGQTVPVESVTLTAEALAGYIANLPRFLARDLTITVSGTLTEPVVIQNFYGSGALRIQAASQGDCVVKNTQVKIINCDVRVELNKLVFTVDETAEATDDANVHVDRSFRVWITESSFTGNGAGRAVMCRNHAVVSIEKLTIKNYETAVSVWDGGTGCLLTVSGENNFYGICVYNAGTAMLSDTELLLGGASNYNNSGLIVRGGSMI